MYERKSGAFYVAGGQAYNTLRLAALVEGPGLPDAGHVKLIDVKAHPWDGAAKRDAAEPLA